MKTGRGWSATAASQGMPRIVDNPPELGRGKRASPPQASEQWPCQPLDFWLLGTRTVRQSISSFKPHQFVVLCYSSPNTPPMPIHLCYLSHWLDYKIHQESCLPQTLLTALGPQPHTRWAFKEMCERKELGKELASGEKVSVSNSSFDGNFYTATALNHWVMALVQNHQSTSNCQ